ncbi:hypothetical protein BC828DRAFT_390791 [Blastocladiella britannica]|nr:hypothetical protein BC828DRAFT_390791 [Blastocladiella britannica]
MTATPIVVSPCEDSVQYFVDHAGIKFYILTNANSCCDFKPMTVLTATSWYHHQVTRLRTRIC